MEHDPFRHPNIKKLKGQFEGSWRFRVGDYRVIYMIDVEQQRVVVVAIAPRGSAYD